MSRGRLQTSLRVITVVVGGYGATSVIVALLAAGLPLSTGLARSEAVVLASMLGFLIYLALLLWGFSVQKLSRLVLGLSGFGGRGLRAGRDCCIVTVDRMEPTFRQSMNWLHTWAGVVVGGLLFWRSSGWARCRYSTGRDRPLDGAVDPASQCRLRDAVARRPAFDPIAMLAERAGDLNVFSPTIACRLRCAPPCLARGDPKSHYYDPADGHELWDPGDTGGERILVSVPLTIYTCASWQWRLQA